MRRSGGGRVCFTFTHTRIAATMMMASQIKIRLCGQLTQRLTCFSLPVMYCPGTPGRARKRKISQKNIASAAMNHTPTSTVISQNRLSVFTAYDEARGTKYSIWAIQPIMPAPFPRLTVQDEYEDGA